MTVSIHSALGTIHLASLACWCLALMHRASRGEVITGHTPRAVGRTLGGFGTLLTGIWFLHLNQAWLVERPIQAAAMILLGVIGLDHLVFNRPPSAGLRWTSLFAILVYAALIILQT